MFFSYNKFFSFIFLIFISTICYSQRSKNAVISEEAERIRNLVLTDADDIYQKGLEILHISKSDEEYMYAYSMMADALYKKEKYSEALKYFKKTDSLQEKLNHRTRFFTNFFMTDIYQRVGLSVKAKESIKKAVLHSGKLDEKLVKDLISQQEAVFLEDTYDYCRAISIREQNVEYAEERFENDRININNKTGLFSYYNILAFNYLKCERLKDAQEYLKKSEYLIDDTLIEKSDMVYLYFMNKAILEVENQNIKTSKNWFDKALESAEKTKDNIKVKEVLQERINYNVDDLESKKLYINQLNLLRQNTKIEAAKIIRAEEELKNEAIKSKENYLILLYGASIAFLIGIIVLIKVNKRKKKRLKIQFERTIENIKKQNILENKERERFAENNQHYISNESNSSQTKISEKNDNKEATSTRIMSEEKEIELLSKLEEFEKGNEFTDKNFTISTMASLFETNTKYINYILQQHREKLFSDYINTMRIQYLSKLLYNNPEYLNYKISYLSDLAGYSSHSRFASVFKKETGISPSEFISRLTAENDI